RVSRVQIDRRAERGGALPELPDRRLVEVLRRLGVPDIAVSVDQRALETQLRERPLEFFASRGWVLQRYRGEPGEPSRVPADDLGQFVIQTPRGVDSPVALGYALHARLRQRQHHRLD